MVLRGAIKMLFCCLSSMRFSLSVQNEDHNSVVYTYSLHRVMYDNKQKHATLEKQRGGEKLGKQQEHEGNENEPMSHCDEKPSNTNHHTPAIVVMSPLSLHENV